MNSYSSVLNYNHIDYQAMLDKEEKKDKKYHETSMIRQFIYFLIFLIMFIGYKTVSLFIIIIIHSTGLPQ